jgi:hypothetical protein
MCWASLDVALFRGHGARARANVCRHGGFSEQDPTVWFRRPPDRGFQGRRAGLTGIGASVYSASCRRCLPLRGWRRLYASGVDLSVPRKTHAVMSRAQQGPMVVLHAGCRVSIPSCRKNALATD